MDEAFEINILTKNTEPGSRTTSQSPVSRLPHSLRNEARRS